MEKGTTIKFWTPDELAILRKLPVLEAKKKLPGRSLGSIYQKKTFLNAQEKKKTVSKAAPSKDIRFVINGIKITIAQGVEHVFVSPSAIKIDF